MQELQRRNSAKSDVDLPIPAATDALAVVRRVLAQHGTQCNIPSTPTPLELSDQSWVLPTFLRSFNHYNYEGHLEEISQAIYPRTCNWILKTDELSRWASTQEPSLLWLTGHPGIGKSTLASYLTLELRNPREAFNIGLKSTVVYSFCEYQRNDTLSMIISTAIHQMLRQFPSLQAFAYQADRWECLGTSHSRIMKGKHRSSSILWHLFVLLVKNSGLEKIFLIIDALDVCREPEQDALLRLFALAFEHPRQSKTHLKIFISSRPGDHIAIIQSKWVTRYPETFNHIETTQHETFINQDIDNFVEKEAARVRTLRGYSLQEMGLIKQHLSASEYKSFLSVTLYFKHLEKAPPSKLAEVLKSVSNNLGVFYQTLVSQLPPRLQYSPSQLMTFITYSFRSLTVAELALASWWDEKGSSGTVALRAELKTPLDDENDIKAKATVEMYYPLLKIGKGGSVGFFHDSIRDFIIQRVGCRSDFFVGSAKKAHRDLALICIRTITLKSNLAYPETWSTDYQRPRFLPEKHVLLSYAMQFWHKHIQEAVPSDTQIDEIDDEILLAVKDLVGIWRRGTTVSYRQMLLSYLGIQLDERSSLKNLTPLEVLSALGLDPFLRAFLKLPDVESSLNIMIPDAENAIKLAIKGGHEGALAILLATFKITSLEGEKFKTIIADSAWSGRPDLLQQVLRLRNSRSQELRAALIAAFIKGDHESLDHLVRDQTIFQDRDHFGMTVLHAMFSYRGSGEQKVTAAARTVYLAIVEYLVNHGVGINSRDNYGLTPLHWACSNPIFCETSVIDFLVLRGADPQSQSIAGLTPLHFAAYYATSIGPIERLLELGSINLLGMASRGRMTPLHWAVSRPVRCDNYGFDTAGTVIEYFLRRGADIKAPNLRGLTPLEWCTSYRVYELQTIHTSFQGIDTIAITHHPDTRVFILWEGWAGVTPEALSQITHVLAQDELENGAELDSIGQQFIISSHQIYVRQSSGSNTPQRVPQSCESGTPQGDPQSCESGTPQGDPQTLRTHFIRVPRRLRKAWKDIRRHQAER
ncbi:hypothetical protein BGZ60DRAFT_205933 [Tricladium varicosporioides]|nr:hypothetical protein BGZ60DRAFT_205933 [Hymenoscyphus varicosporioides]